MIFWCAFCACFIFAPIVRAVIFISRHWGNKTSESSLLIIGERIE